MLRENESEKSQSELREEESEIGRRLLADPDTPTGLREILLDMDRHGLPLNLKGYLEWGWGKGTKLSDLHPEERDAGVPDELREDAEA